VNNFRSQLIWGYANDNYRSGEIDHKENRTIKNENTFVLTVISNHSKVFIAKIAYKNQNEWVSIGEESFGVLFQRKITLQSNRTSLWKGKYTK